MLQRRTFYRHLSQRITLLVGCDRLSPKELTSSSGKPDFNDEQIDCPGAGLCAINQTWQIQKANGQCTCNTWAGFTGTSCFDWCGQAYGIIFVNSIAICLALIALTMAITFLALKFKDQYKTQIWARPSVRRARNAPGATAGRTLVDPVTLTLILGAITGLLTIIGNCTGLVFNLGFRSLYVVIEGHDGRVRKVMPSEFQKVNIFFTALAYCCSACTINVIPLTWVSFRQDALRKQTRPVSPKLTSTGIK